MLERVYSFLVVLLLMFSGEIFSQKGNENESIKLDIKCIDSLKGCWSNSKYQRLFLLYQKKCVDSTSSKQSMPYLLKLFPASFYSSNLGFICKKEWQLEKLTTVPFRFRLGSLDYVNYLEQKPNAIKPLQ